MNTDNEKINPPYYGRSKDVKDIPVRREEPIELIELTEQLPYTEGNIVKYVVRWQHKAGLQDLYKAQWFLSRLIAKAEAEEAFKNERKA